MNKAVASVLSGAALLVALLLLERWVATPLIVDDVLLATPDNDSFVVSGDQFTKDGRPLRLLSGSFHYFRTPRELWPDRLAKIRHSGLNAVETYVPWNLVEPTPDRFEGLDDLTEFLRLASDAGLLVVLRPGPYICAEWEFGGLPSWLLGAASPGVAIRLRSSDPRFLRRASLYLERVLGAVRPFVYNNREARRKDRAIVALQVENEYGSFGSDLKYLEELTQVFRRNLPRSVGGNLPVLFGSNGRRHLDGETASGVLRTANFGPGSERVALAQLRMWQKSGPKWVAEYWVGWFDHWSESLHHGKTVDAVVSGLREILDAGASVNMYMFVGGTSFGLMNGANYAFNSSKTFQPTVTSYDYDAPISECGDVTPKYYAIREVLLAFKSGDPPTARTFPPVRKAKLAETKAEACAGLLENAEALADVVLRDHVSTLPMEYLNQSVGFVSYETTIPDWLVDDERPNVLELRSVHDRAFVFLGDELEGIVWRGNDFLPLSRQHIGIGLRLRVLVENLGRINYGVELEEDYKGITVGVLLNGAFLANWTMRALSLPLTALEKLAWQSGSQCNLGQRPRFLKFSVPAGPEALDTFVDTAPWRSSGIVWVNAHNLGRFDSLRGPQMTLYCPGPFLRASGVNDFVVLDLQPSERRGAETLTFVTEPKL